MNTNGNTFKFLFYRLSFEPPVGGISVLYSSNIDQLKSLIQSHKQYRIILVCKAGHLQEIYDSIIERHIDEMFILGDCIDLNIKDKKVTMINTDEKDLIFEVLSAAIRYTHDDQMRERQQENNGLANALAMDVLNLLSQIRLLL